MMINTDFSASALQSFAQIASASADRLSISLLQRKLRIGYQVAIDLLAQMEQCGFVARDGDAQWQLTPVFRASLHKHATSVDKQAEAETQYIDIGNYTHGVLRLAAYLHEMAEEGECGHARAVSLLKPELNVGDIEIRDVFHQIYRNAKPSVMDATILMHRWFVLHAGVRCTTGVFEAKLAEFTMVVNRPWCAINDRDSKIDRAAHRLAAYLQQAVAPCSYLVRASLALLRQGWPTREVATFIRRCLAVVEISREDKKTLEGSGLAEEMPQGWCARSGDIFARLHRAGIAFAQP
jgi:hypothetical protein